jgi:hypothetical protein
MPIIGQQRISQPSGAPPCAGRLSLSGLNGVLLCLAVTA